MEQFPEKFSSDTLLQPTGILFVRAAFSLCGKGKQGPDQRSTQLPSSKHYSSKNCLRLRAPPSLSRDGELIPLRLSQTPLPLLWQMLCTQVQCHWMTIATHRSGRQRWGSRSVGRYLKSQLAVPFTLFPKSCLLLGTRSSSSSAATSPRTT